MLLSSVRMPPPTPAGPQAVSRILITVIVTATGEGGFTLTLFTATKNFIHITFQTHTDNILFVWPQTTNVESVGVCQIPIESIFVKFNTENYF